MGGRYDRSKKLKHNLSLPAPILSRFDLVHVMIDEPDEFRDYTLARGTSSRCTSGARARWLWTTRCRSCSAAPLRAHDPPQAHARGAEGGGGGERVRLRQGDSQPGSQAAYRITVRQLEALVRLSEALARVHCRKDVLPAHVREARRLLSESIIAVPRRAT